MSEHDPVDEALKSLSDKMRDALLKRQLAAFMPDAVFARGAVTGALRRRGLIKGGMPNARLTPLGVSVVERLEA